MTSVRLLPNPGGLGRDYFAHARPARLYEYLLDGREHHHVDREAARAVSLPAPWLSTAALINRDFACRSVEHCLGLGVRQFLDLGCGYPAKENVHQLTATVAPGCPVVYVDHDPGVHAHGATLLDVGPPHRTTVVHADLLDMGTLLGCAAVRAAFDLDRPVAVLMHDVLPWCGDDGAVHAALAALRAWMPPGSVLSITHLTDHWHRATMPDVVSALAAHGLHVRPRCLEEIGDLFGGFAQLGPGLAATGRWHARGSFSSHPQECSAAFAGIAVKPARPSRRRA